MVTRSRQNFISGSLGAQLNAGATSMTSNALMELDTIAAPDIAIIVLDPLQVNGDPEIVYVTVHTLGQPNATIFRGEELTADRMHPIGTEWKHAPVADDWDFALDYATTTELADVDMAAESAGTSDLVARGDHKHLAPTGTPSGAANVNTAGASNSFPRLDHQHKRDVRVAKAGSDIGTRNRLNFIEGTDISITVTDDVGSDEIDITVANTAPAAASVLFARKIADESVTSSTTFQDDDHLTVSVVANTIYEFTCYLRYEAHVDGDLKWKFVGPLNAILRGGYVNWNTSLALSLEQLQINFEANSGGSGAGVIRDIMIHAIAIIDSTAGTFKLQWAQTASNATATILKEGSFFTLREVA